jgi:RimJ/RimL family protein N-acetyltransferase
VSTTPPVAEPYYLGQHTIVRPLTADDLFALYPRPEVQAALAAYRPWQGELDIGALAQRLAWLASFEQPPELEALVLHPPSGTPLGFLCLSAIDLGNAKAELSVAFFRGKHSRAALEAMLWVLDAAFARFRLDKLIFHVLADNTAAQQLLATLSIPQEAVLRGELAATEVDGPRRDLLRYALFRDDWRLSPGRARLQRLTPLSTPELP